VELLRGSVKAYWLGPEDLRGVWTTRSELDPGPRFYYGDDFMTIDEYDTSRIQGGGCPQREGPGGVVVGELPTEQMETTFGPAEFCPTDGWLSLRIHATHVIIYPGQRRESKEEMLGAANRLRPVE